MFVVDDVTGFRSKSSLDVANGSIDLFVLLLVAVLLFHGFVDAFNADVMLFEAFVAPFPPFPPKKSPNGSSSCCCFGAGSPFKLAFRLLVNRSKSSCAAVAPPYKQIYKDKEYDWHLDINSITPYIIKNM